MITSHFILDYYIPNLLYLIGLCFVPVRLNVDNLFNIFPCINKMVAFDTHNKSEKS